MKNKSIIAIQIIAAYVSIWSIGCKLTNNNESYSALDSNQSISAQNNQPPPPKVFYKIDFKQGTTISSQEVSEDIEITSNAPDSEIESIQITEDSTISGNLNSSPLLYRVNLVGKTQTISIQAIAKFKNGQSATTKIDIHPSMGGKGKLADNCMSDNSFKACIFWKNPVAEKKSPFNPAISYGADLSAYQTYGIQLAGLSSQTNLSNGNFNIKCSAGKLVTPDTNGSFKYAYSQDKTTHYVAQLMAFNWLSEELDIIKNKAGRFYAEGKAIQVDAFNNTVQSNAYWDGQNIVLGYNAKAGASEMALGADVYMHELGHGDLQYALGTKTTSSTCKTSAGCIGAINEGQADFHVALIFSQNPTLGEHFFNSTDGMPGRNVLKNHALTGASAFSSGGGEVHNMGAVYASLLWEMYVHPKMNPRDFAKIFEMHLTMLTNNSTIENSKTIFQSINETYYNSKYAQVIDEVYKLKGY